MSDTMSDTMPDTMPDTMADTMPDTMPDNRPLSGLSGIVPLKRGFLPMFGARWVPGRA